MSRQREAQRVAGGRGYPTEIGGRDRVKFFRRPVEPDSTMLSTANNAARAVLMENQFAASYPSLSMHSEAAYFTSMMPAGGGGAARGGPGRSGLRPFSSLGLHPRQSRSPNRGPNALLRKNGASLRKAKPHHLPSLSRSGSGEEHDAGDGRVAVSVQTALRDNEAQTDPYSPDYFIPEGMPEPEILGLQSLTYQSGGLPAGKESVELIQRLRRRREVEASLPTGNDAASIEARYTTLHALEEKEWAEREEHVAVLQERRLDRLKESLLEREAAREDVNRARLEKIKAQYMSTLTGKLTSLERRRVAASKRGIDKMAQLQAEGGAQAPSFTDAGDASLQASVAAASLKGGTTTNKGGRSKPSIAGYARYGTVGAPPGIEQVGVAATTSIDARLRAARQAFNYDVRPQLLADTMSAEEVDAARGAQVDRVSAKTFEVPHNEAVQRLPTLYQRREAERVLNSLEYAYNKLHPSDETVEGKKSEMSAQRVLDLYRATPKLQRPETPVLELDGDDEEEEEDACILLQRLLRGRAVQNDFFDGRERCRGLIEELQAASKAQTAEQRGAARRKEEVVAKEREAEAQHIIGSALGAVVHDTLGFLSQELVRQQDMAALRKLQEEAEVVRATREAAERERRAEVRQQRDRIEVAYAAYMRATGTTLHCFLDDVSRAAVEETAMTVAVATERERQAAQPSPQEPTTREEAETAVCDMLDGFLIPAIVDAIALQNREFEKKAIAGAALDASHAISKAGGMSTGQ